ncbi:MAG TPA: sulfite exporter TauE/SafE family protein [Pilimelia sp.]|nr:sulfite exporter TauE/SafE family protein [Pilimelia sp.]
MELWDAGIMLVAGLAAGTVNALAGGGSLISFPTLVALGMPPVAANVTNSVAVCPGYMAAVAGSRADLAGQGARMRGLLPTTVVGAGAGCALLLLTPAGAFEVVVPFLVLTAAGALAVQDRLRRLVVRRQEQGPVALHLLVGLGALYGGYFGAALGVLLVAGLALALDETLARVSAAKNAISAVVGLVTAVAFGVFGPVDWAAAGVLASSALVGGYAGARLLRRLPAAVLRWLIVGFGVTVGLILLARL